MPMENVAHVRHFTRLWDGKKRDPVPGTDDSLREYQERTGSYASLAHQWKPYRTNNGESLRKWWEFTSHAVELWSQAGLELTDRYSFGSVCDGKTLIRMCGMFQGILDRKSSETQCHLHVFVSCWWVCPSRCCCCHSLTLDTSSLSFCQNEDQWLSRIRPLLQAFSARQKLVGIQLCGLSGYWVFCIFNMQAAIVRLPSLDHIGQTNKSSL